MSFADASFDRILSLGVIHFWAEAARPLAETRRVLRPGGFALMGCLAPRSANDLNRLEHGFFLRQASEWESLPRCRVCRGQGRRTGNRDDKSRRHAGYLLLDSGDRPGLKTAIDTGSLGSGEQHAELLAQTGSVLAWTISTCASASAPSAAKASGVVDSRAIKNARTPPARRAHQRARTACA